MQKIYDETGERAKNLGCQLYKAVLLPTKNSFLMMIYVRKSVRIHKLVNVLSKLIGWQKFEPNLLRFWPSRFFYSVTRQLVGCSKTSRLRKANLTLSNAFPTREKKFDQGIESIWNEIIFQLGTLMVQPSGSSSKIQPLQNLRNFCNSQSVSRSSSTKLFYFSKSYIYLDSFWGVFFDFHVVSFKHIFVLYRRHTLQVWFFYFPIQQK